METHKWKLHVLWYMDVCVYAYFATIGSIRSHYCQWYAQSWRMQAEYRERPTCQVCPSSFWWAIFFVLSCLKIFLLSSSINSFNYIHSSHVQAYTHAHTLSLRHPLAHIQCIHLWVNVVIHVFVLIQLLDIDVNAGLQLYVKKEKNGFQHTSRLITISRFGSGKPEY